MFLVYLLFEYGCCYDDDNNYYKNKRSRNKVCRVKHVVINIVVKIDSWPIISGYNCIVMLYCNC